MKEMIDIEKISKEHSDLFPRADLGSQLIKLNEEKSEAMGSLQHYARELADCLIVAAGIYRFDKEQAMQEVYSVYDIINKLGVGFQSMVEMEVDRKWDVDQLREWVWDGKTYKHKGKDNWE